MSISTNVPAPPAPPRLTASEVLSARCVPVVLAAALTLLGITACEACGGAAPVDDSASLAAAPATGDIAAAGEHTRGAYGGVPLTPEVEVITEPRGERYELSRFRFSLGETEVRAVDLDFERTLASTLEAEGARLVINGGYWHTDMEPEGLTRVGGEELAPFSASLGGGVLVIAGGVGRLLDAEDPAFEVPEGVSFAQQCMPRIVVDGALNIGRDTGRRADRTALCLRDGGRLLDVYIARGGDPAGHGGPTLYTFGEVLVERGCEDALNLDGGGSTGAVWRTPDGRGALPPRVALRLALVFE